MRQGPDRSSHEAAEEAHVIEEHQGLVAAQAQQLLSSLSLRVERDDLIAYGNMGLLKAWRRFDADRGVAFTTFAYYRIKGAMLDGCRREGWLPRRRKSQARAEQALNTYASERLEERADTPKSTSFSESVSRVSDRIGEAFAIVMLEEHDLERVVGDVGPRQNDQIERREQNDRLHEAISQLDEEERILIKRHHYYGDSLTDIAQDLNKSKSWCSRMHARAIERLRDLLSPQDELPEATAEELAGP